MSEVLAAGLLGDAWTICEVACTKILGHVRGGPGGFGVVEYWETCMSGRPVIGGVFGESLEKSLNRELVDLIRELRGDVTGGDE
jgi:hypothetical protein